MSEVEFADRGRRLSVGRINNIRRIYAQTKNITTTSIRVGVTNKTVRKYLSQNAFLGKCLSQTFLIIAISQYTLEVQPAKYNIYLCIVYINPLHCFFASKVTMLIENYSVTPQNNFYRCHPRLRRWSDHFLPEMARAHLH